MNFDPTDNDVSSDWIDSQIDWEDIDEDDDRDPTEIWIGQLE